MTNEQEVNEFVAKVEKEVGTIDVLVNNPGYLKRIPMLEMSAEAFRQVVDVDFERTIYRIKSGNSRNDQKRTWKNH